MGKTSERTPQLNFVGKETERSHRDYQVFSNIYYKDLKGEN